MTGVRIMLTFPVTRKHESGEYPCLFKKKLHPLLITLSPGQPDSLPPPSTLVFSPRGSSLSLSFWLPPHCLSVSLAFPPPLLPAFNKTSHSISVHMVFSSLHYPPWFGATTKVPLVLCYSWRDGSAVRSSKCSCSGPSI